MAKGNKNGGSCLPKLAMEGSQSKDVDCYYFPEREWECVPGFEKICLLAFLDNNEPVSYQTPTSFIQSTHNNGSGQISVWIWGGKRL